MVSGAGDLESKNGCEYVHLTLQPGSVVAPHRLPFPVSFYLVSGKGSVSLGDAQFEVEQGGLLKEVEAGAPRGWKNLCPADPSILVIKHTGSP